MHIHRYERWWMIFGIIMLVLFMATIFVAAFADNINPPSGSQTIDPTKVNTTPPFDHPGLAQPRQRRATKPITSRRSSCSRRAKLQIPVGSKRDVLRHQLRRRSRFRDRADRRQHDGDSRLGQQHESHRSARAGTYLLVCNEYCGIGHQNMYGTIEVK